MTSNNLKAIELLKTCAERLQDQGFSSHGNTVSELNKAIELLQADEDIEVKKKGDYEFVSTGHELDGSPTIVFRCACGREHTMDAMTHEIYRTNTPPKPTKETKLKELKNSLTLSKMADRFALPGELIKLIDILLEEEY